MKDFKFSVLICVYAGDDARFFKMAIESILENSVAATEIILVIDGPIGQEIENVISRDLLEQCERAKVFRLEKNSGLAKALNYGLSKCSYDWVFRADADDINMINRFETQINDILSNPDCDIFGSYITEYDDFQGEYVRSVPESDKKISNFVRWRSPFNHMTVAYNRAAVLRFGGYPDIFRKEDYALWRMMIGHGIKGYNNSLVLVRAYVGNGMHERRGGLCYLKSEFQLQKFFYAVCKEKFVICACAGIVRISIFMMPVVLKKFVYKNFLRN